MNATNPKMQLIKSAHRPQSSSFLGLPYSIRNMNPKKELLWGLWVGLRDQAYRLRIPKWVLAIFKTDPECPLQFLGFRGLGFSGLGFRV